MNWPTSQDYNESIQNAATSFSDPDLKTGEVVVNAIGLPAPCSGNFADVYQFKGGDGKTWALKCFTRKVAGLQERYAKIDEHIGKANFPFTVGFKYLAEGIRVRGQWFPLLKMEWVEGFTLNEFIRNNAGKPQYLQAILQMWSKLCGRLRDGNFAHADLQHGNVLLAPGDAQNKLVLKLIDYDGMYVPSLAEHHSGEIGHPNFQHPLRLKERLFNGDVDRFPHLVIACALRATMLGGRALWDRFDNGDNLLFKEVDLRDPANAPVFKSLWDLNDDLLCVLLGKLALASKEPMRKTPWLDDLLLTEEVERLSAAEEKKVMEMLGVGPHFTAASKTVAVGPVPLAAPTTNEFADFEGGGEEADQPPAEKRKLKPSRAANPAKAKQLLPYYVGGGVVAAAMIAGIVVLATGDKPALPPQPEVAAKDIKKDNSPAKTTSGNPTKKVGPPETKKEPAVVEIVKNDPPLIPVVPTPMPTPTPGKKDSTEILGGGANPVVFREATEAGLLVGLEVGVGKYAGVDVIRTLRPFYRDGTKETSGKQVGRENSGVVTVMAKPGYAVGAILVKSDQMVNGFSVTFMKVVDGKLDPKNSYESEWIGGNGGALRTTLAGDGRPIVGVTGKTGPFGNVNGIGLALQAESSDPREPRPEVVKKETAAIHTGIRGGGIGSDHRDVSETGLLVGMDVGLGKWFKNDVIQSIRPIFREGDKDSPGKQWGKESTPLIRVLAKPGYAIGAITIKSVILVDGFSVTFMKIADGKLDPADSYESDWVGGGGTLPKFKLGGDGNSVVGIIGKTNPQGNVGALGLALKPASAGDVKEKSGPR